MTGKEKKIQSLPEWVLIYREKMIGKVFTYQKLDTLEL